MTTVICLEDTQRAFLLLEKCVFNHVPDNFHSEWVLEQNWFALETMENVNLAAHVLLQFGFLRPHMDMTHAQMAELDTNSTWTRTKISHWDTPGFPETCLEIG